MEVEANWEWENAVSANVNERNQILTKADKRNSNFSYLPLGFRV
jgi:hypothetical protein